MDATRRKAQLIKSLLFSSVNSWGLHVDLFVAPRAGKLFYKKYIPSIRLNHVT